jgi:hypothetical protein
MTISKNILESYLRHLGGALFSAVATISTINGTSPLQFEATDWFAVANALWVAILPVLFRYFNKQDPVFGKVAEALADEVTKTLKTKSTKK